MLGKWEPERRLEAPLKAVQQVLRLVPEKQAGPLALVQGLLLQAAQRAEQRAPARELLEPVAVQQELGRVLELLLLELLQQAGQQALVQVLPERLAALWGQARAPELSQPVSQQQVVSRVLARVLAQSWAAPRGQGRVLDWWLPGLRQLAVLPELGRASQPALGPQLPRPGPEGPVRALQQHLSELQARAQALRPAEAARRDLAQGPAVWRPGGLHLPAVEVQARAPEMAEREG